MNHIETKVLISVIGLLGSFSVLFMKDISENIRELNVKVDIVLEENISLVSRVNRIENIVYKN